MNAAYMPNIDPDFMCWLSMKKEDALIVYTLSNGCTGRISLPELATIDERLPPLFDYLSTSSKSPDEFSDKVELLKANLQFWSEPSIRWELDVKDTSNYLNKINALLEHNYGIIKMITTDYVVNPNVLDFPIVVAEFERHRLYSEDWLENKFPGMLEHLKLGTTFDLNPEELADYVFYHQSYLSQKENELLPDFEENTTKGV